MVDLVVDVEESIYTCRIGMTRSQGVIENHLDVNVYKIARNYSPSRVWV